MSGWSRIYVSPDIIIHGDVGSEHFVCYSVSRVLTLQAAALVILLGKPITSALVEFAFFLLPNPL